MSTLTLLLIRLAFLAVLWLFVITAVGVVRTDLFGQSPASRKQKRQRQNARPRPARPARHAVSRSGSWSPAARYQERPCH